MYCHACGIALTQPTTKYCNRCGVQLVSTRRRTQGENDQKATGRTTLTVCFGLGFRAGVYCRRRSVAEEGGALAIS